MAHPTYSAAESSNSLSNNASRSDSLRTFESSTPKLFKSSFLSIGQYAIPYTIGPNTGPLDKRVRTYLSNQLHEFLTLLIYINARTTYQIFNCVLTSQPRLYQEHIFLTCKILVLLTSGQSFHHYFECSDQYSYLIEWMLYFCLYCFNLPLSNHVMITHQTLIRQCIYVYINILI